MSHSRPISRTAFRLTAARPIFASSYSRGQMTVVGAWAEEYMRDEDDRNYRLAILPPYDDASGGGYLHGRSAPSAHHQLQHETTIGDHENLLECGKNQIYRRRID